jgi:antitoxin component YwqK of YwqJK toxin-antitoxin module
MTEAEKQPGKRPFRVSRVTFLLLLCLAAMAFVFFFPPTDEPRTTTLPEVQRSALTLRDGRLYRDGERAPFRGFMIESYVDGDLKSRSAVSNGMVNGVSEGWHTNGVMQLREHFVEGVAHGVREEWFESGKKQSESMIVNGKLHGLFRRWHENGQLAEEIEMKEGEPDGIARSYYPSGFLKTTARLENGKLINQTNWNDGEQKPSADGK